MWEVSAYGNVTVGDDKDHWQIEVVNDAASRDRTRIRTLTTGFRLRHVALDCYLRAGNVNLPQWGFKQIEVTCAKKAPVSDVYTHWNVEAHTNDKLPAGNPGAYKSPFWRDFIHLNVAMATSNNALVPDPDKQDDLSSEWYEWLHLGTSLRMCGWGDETIKYLLLGNPFVFALALASVLSLPLIVLWYLVRFQRGYNDLKPAEIDHIHYAGLWPFIGFSISYFTFGLQSRVLYLHHVIPCQEVNLFVGGFVIDWLTRPLARKNKTAEWAIYGCLYALIIGVFVYFSPMTFGMVGSHKKYAHLAWRKEWRFSDP